MKKLLFSALACVAFAFSGFASNEVVGDSCYSIVEDKGDLKPCVIKIYATAPDGQLYEFGVISDGKVSSDDCDNAKKAKVTELEKKEYKIERTSVTWG